MTTDEREQLMGFLRLMDEARAGQKDAQAEALIREACARQPDAAYLLVQRVMQLERAAQGAQAETEQLKRELAQARTGLPASSFLGSPNSWGRQPVAPQAKPPGAQPASSAAPASAAAPAASSWGAGLLGTVATTAAGVVAGSLLFQGIGSLMNRHESNHAPTDPGGGGKVDTSDRYGDSLVQRQAETEYVAEDFNSGDAADFDGGSDPA